MINNLIQDNAFFILGLDSSSSQKVIIKRSKEIFARLKIGDYIEYDFDLKIVKKLRNETNVKQAQKNLSESRIHLSHYFFWFEIEDKIDEIAFKHISNNDYTKALAIWNTKIKSAPLKSQNYKKNLCILYCLLLLTDNASNNEYIQNSLILWNSLINSNEFWEDFNSQYLLIDDLDVDPNVLKEFSSKVTLALCDIYTDIQIKSKNNNVLFEYFKYFNFKSSKFEQEILNPIFEEINLIINDLKNIYHKKDTSSVNEFYSNTKIEISKLFICLEQLEIFGIVDESTPKLLRDKAALTISSIAWDLFSNHLEYEKAIHLSEICKKISGTFIHQNAFNENIKTIESFKKQKEVSNQLVRKQIKENNQKKWIKWFAISFFILLVVLAKSSSISSSSINLNNTSRLDCSNINNGSYCCSQAISNQANALKVNPYIQSQLEAEYLKLQNELYYLNHSDQKAIDSYNIDLYLYNANKGNYNNKLETYNKFISNNCILK